MTIYYIAPLIGMAALICAGWLIYWINKNDAGNARMQEIALYIRQGAKAFLVREYKTIVVFVVVMFFILTFIPGLGLPTACMFLLGSLFSILAGYVGMMTATRANVRTVAAAMKFGMNKSLKIAFRGGAVMGLSVVGLDYLELVDFL